MNILFINYEYPPLGGGSAIAAFNLANEFSHLGCKILVLTTFYPGLKTHETKKDFSIVRIKSKRKHIAQSNPWEMLSFTIETLKTCDNIVRNFSPDKVLAFFTIPSGITALYLKFRYKIPYIISLRGGDVPGFQKQELFVYHTLLLPIILLIWRFAKHIVANSQSLKELAQKTAKLINKQVEVITNGVDLTIFKPDKNEDKTVKRILFVGRLAKQKNIETLLKALHMLNNKFNTEFRAEIIGDGPENKNLRKFTIKLQLAELVKFSGWVDRSKLSKKYQSADLFVLPSIYEGMSNSLLEAMASGLPVIAANIAGNQNLIKSGHNGLLFKKFNYQELAGCIIKILNNPQLRKRLSQQAIKTARNFSWQESAKQYYSLFKIKK